jgi:hypothetical protein
MKKEALCDIFYKKSAVVSNALKSLQKTYAAETHPADGQFLLQEQPLSKANPKTNSSQKKMAEFRTEVKLNKEECTKAIFPHT